VNQYNTPLSPQVFICKRYIKCSQIHKSIQSNKNEISKENSIHHNKIEGKSPYDCYFLSLRWFSLEEERVMQQSRGKYFPQLENQGINPVGGTSKSPIYAPAQTIKHLHQRDKGVVNPFSVTCKDEI
jgi:hypothetical protein